MISIRLDDPAGAPLPAARPGQYLTLRVQPDGDERSVLRNYSLSGPPAAGYYRITVKREHDGAASGYLHTRLARRRPARRRGTARHLHPRPGRRARLLISAGIGATPVLAMLHALAQEHSDVRSGGSTAPQQPRAPFAAEARALLASLPSVRTHIYYSRPGPDDREGRDFDTRAASPGSLLAGLGPPRNAEAYLCGPTPFMDEISAGLAAIGRDASQIHTEPFGPAPGLTPGSQRHRSRREYGRTRTCTARTTWRATSRSGCRTKPPADVDTSSAVRSTKRTTCSTIRTPSLHSIALPAWGSGACCRQRRARPNCLRRSRRWSGTSPRSSQ